MRHHKGFIIAYFEGQIDRQKQTLNSKKPSTHY